MATRRLVAILAVSQSLASLGVVSAHTVGAIGAARLSGQPAYSGFPSTLFLLGAALAAYPTGRLIDRFGRRAGLVAGFLVAVAGALCAFLAVILNQFPLFLAGFALLELGRGGNRPSALCRGGQRPGG